MPRALSTQGQGSTAHIAFPNFIPNASSATGGTAFFEIEYELHELAGNGFGYIVGNSSATAAGMSVTSAFALRLGIGASIRITSVNGIAALNRRDTIRAEYDDTGSGTTAQWRLYHKAGESGTLTPIGSWIGSINLNQMWVNQIGRGGTANYNPLTVYRVSCGSTGSAANYDALWDDTTATGSGTSWLDTLGANALTITNATGAADSWWLYYAAGTYIRAMLQKLGIISQITDAELGTGKKPLVLLSDGTIKERAASEGQPLVYDASIGGLRTIASNEILQI